MEWRTDTPDTKDEVMVTCQSGSARWVLPGCYYRRGRWYHTIVEAHDVEIDPEGAVEHIGEEEERVMAEVIAWAEYPDPFGMESEPVIRCKDCKYYHEDSYGEDEWVMCRRTNLYTDGEKYCAWAERKKE